MIQFNQSMYSQEYSRFEGAIVPDDDVFWVGRHLRSDHEFGPMGLGSELCLERTRFWNWTASLSGYKKHDRIHWTSEGAVSQAIQTLVLFEKFDKLEEMAFSPWRRCIPASFFINTCKSYC
jgi:hypothetical protein